MESFHFGTELSDLLFKNWNTTTWKDFIVTFLFFVFLAVMLEAVARLELLLGQYYLSNPLTWTWRDDRPQGRSQSSLLEPLRIPSSLSKIRKRRLKIHAFKCVLHVVRIFVGYLLMLAVMTYNAFLLIAVVAGSTAGYCVFGRFEKLKLPRRQLQWHPNPLNSTQSPVSSPNERRELNL